MRPWLTAGVWMAWFVLAGGVGGARARTGDRIEDRGTRVWADVATAASLLCAIAAAIFVPVAAIPADPWLTLLGGSAVVLIGIVLRRWAGRTLGPFFTQSVVIRERHRVITAGPYRYVRHPGYAGMLLSLAGLALTLGNWLSVLLAILGFFGGHLPRIRVEERALEANLADEYRDYERGRKRLIPGIW